MTWTLRRLLLRLLLHLAHGGPARGEGVGTRPEGR